jgi:septal ring factor EnvC (AmiA/AmiB activator)
LQRASTTDHLASRNRRLEEIIGKVRKKDSDFCLDQNEVLRIVHRYFMNLEQALPDKPLDEACSLKSTIESIATAAGKSAEKRPMAERMLFSGSIADRHRRAAQYIGGLFCQKQAKQLCAVLDNLTAIRQHIEKNNSEEKRQATAPSATNDAEPKAKDTQKNGP